jgi:tRNA-dihydrouridine synthase B
MNFYDLNIEPAVFLAPMAGVSDYPYRQLVREMGVKLLYTEMISAKGYVYGNRRTSELLKFDKGKQGAIAVQLFGEDPEFMARAAAGITQEYEVDLIDINLGCPAAKIVKTGAGSALMKTPQLAAKVISETVKAVQIPVTVKMRSGWDDNNLNAIQIAKLAENSGAAAVAVHGRTRQQFYKGQADWQIIKNVKAAVNIPVIGNGDIFSDLDAEAILASTNCDGIMIGRAAQGNPWIFKEIIYYLKTGNRLKKINNIEKINFALRHLKLSVDYYGEDYGIPIMRKHLAWYLKGMPNASEMRNKINQLTDYFKLIKLLNNYKNDLDND